MVISKEKGLQGLAIGEGLAQWLKDHQGTPLSDETYQPPDYLSSSLSLIIGNEAGQSVETQLGWSKRANAIMTPGPGVPYSPSPSPTPSPVPADLQPFVDTVLSDLNFKDEQKATASTFLVAWAGCEGGIGHNNPLNVAGQWDGQHGTYEGATGLFNVLDPGPPPFGVLNFDTLVDGGHAAANVLDQDNMSAILDAMYAGNRDAFVQAFRVDPWGTSADCIANSLPVPPAPEPAPAPAPAPAPVAPTEPTHVATGPDDDLIEKDNYQGTDETCGERVVAMAAAEDNIIPVDFAGDQDFAKELLNVILPGADPNTFGGTNLDQQLTLLQYVARKFNKQLQVVGVAAVEGLRDPNYQHKSIAVNLGPMLNINSNHFLLQRKVGGDVGDGYVKVIDSDQALDYSKDLFTEDQVLAGAAALFGQGAQFGWAWNWL